MRLSNARIGKTRVAGIRGARRGICNAVMVGDVHSEGPHLAAHGDDLATHGI